LDQRVGGFDELIALEDNDFATSGLLAASVIRLGFLAVLPRRRVLGAIGSISPQRHKRLLKNLSDHLLQSLQAE
jgi:mRNA interferase MazF